MQDFTNLSAWQRARRLTKSVYELTADFPESEQFGLKSQMRRATVAMGSACELECETILSFDLAFITEMAQELLLEALIQIKRMLGGLLSRLGWGRLPDTSRRSLDSNAKPRTNADD